MLLLPIQEKILYKVVNKLNESAFTNVNYLYFQSPTGSGKTRMLARIIEEYKHSNPQEKLLFLVASISTGGIEYQNYKSLKDSQDQGCDFRVGHIPSALDSPLYQKYHLYDVLTIGESSYKNGSNLYKLNLLQEFLYRKVNDGFKIIFIRDEAHIGNKDRDDDQGSKNLINLKGYFNKVLCLSATFKSENIKLNENNSVILQMSEAQDANLIKKYIILNDGGLKKETDENENLLLNSACKKLKALKEDFLSYSKVLNKTIKPALLIQISSMNLKGSKETKRDSADEANEIKEIVKICQQYNLTVAHATDKGFMVDDGGLYMNKEIKREELQKDNCEIDVIIFKTKLAIGWDIPRASILCQLRNVKSETLHVQTCGRIMRNIFIANDDKLQGLTNDLQKNAMSCWVYSYHESAKEFESFILKLKDEFKDEQIYITKPKEKHNKTELDGYMNKFERKMVDDIYNFFIQNYKDKTIESLLNGNNELICKRTRTIRIGETADDISSLEQQRIVETHKITNQLQLSNEVAGWIMWRSPALMPIIREVLKKLEFMQQIVFGSLLVVGDNAIGEVKLNFSQNRKDGTNSKKLNGAFGDKLVSIKRYYQSIWEDNPQNWKNEIDIELKELPKELRGSDKKDNEVIDDLDELRHVAKIFANNSTDDKIYGTKPEIHFLKKLDVIVEKNPQLLKYVHRNLPSTDGICYTYEDSEKGEYSLSYPDFVLKTNKGSIIICELKSHTDIDSNKSESIAKGYMNNSFFNELDKYVLGVIWEKDKKFKMEYCCHGKKLPTDFNFLNEYEKKLADYTDLDILFDCIGLLENELADSD